MDPERGFQQGLDAAKAGQSRSFSEFEAQALEGLAVMSRTQKGISDTSVSAEKPSLTVEGQVLAERSAANFRRAASLIWENRDRQFQSVEEVRAFIEQVAVQVSEGLLQPGQSLWRTWETKFNQTPPDQIQQEVDEFCAELLERLQAEQRDPVSTAAWIEQRFDSQIHALADGSGRTTRLLSAMVLARDSHPLPQYPGRDDYYREIVKPFPEWEQYYRSLFSEQGESGMNEQKRRQMLGLIQQSHAGQVREGGVMPYWPHCERAAELLRVVLDQTVEATPEQRADMDLAALGHDLYEDTPVTREQIQGMFGKRVDGLIEEMTNRFGDADAAKYAHNLLKGSESARLIKLTDLFDNYNTGASWVSENGVKWTGEFLWPTLEAQWQALRGSAYRQFPATARLLEQKIETARRQFMTALEQAEQP